jgi:subtilisin family serine protease
MQQRPARQQRRRRGRLGLVVAVGSAMTMAVGLPAQGVTAQDEQGSPGAADPRGVTDLLLPDALRDVPVELPQSLRGRVSRPEVVITLTEPSVAEVVADSATDVSARSQRAQRSRIDDQQDAVARQVRALGGVTTARVDTALNALVARVPVGRLDDVAALPDVARVRPLGTYELDLTETVPAIGAKDVQADGFDGTGITVAVLDSGVDYTHAALDGPGTLEAYEAAYGTDPSDPRNTTRDGLFPTSKVVDGYDFVGETWPDAPEAPDEDPIDFEGHGTHVADIIAGKDGVAPGASLLAVKVCSAISSSCSGQALLQGMDFILDPNGDGSIEDAVDVANLSLGSPYGQVQDDLSAAVTNAVALGVTVVASAGNSADRPYIVGSPSTAAGAISVAQTQVPSAVVLPLVLSGGVEATEPNTATVDWAPVGDGFTGDVAVVGRGCPAGSVAEESPEDPYLSDPSGKVALIDRGGCAVSLKVDRAAKAGAVAVLVANNAPGDPPTFSFGGGDTFVPTLIITQARGNQIKAAIAGGNAVTASVSADTAIPVFGGMVASSSRGPTVSFDTIKPDIGAPGASVSAVAGSGDGTQAFGGTSGAAPMVAGSAALLLDARGPLDPAVVKGLLMGNAETDIETNPATAPGVLAPITRIGGGEVRVDRAVAGQTVATAVGDSTGGAASLSFRFHDVAEPRTVTKRLRVENLGSRAVTYRVVPTFRYADDEASGAVEVVAPGSVRVPAGGARVIRVQLRIDPAQVPDWPLNGGARGGTGALLQQAEFDGYLELQAGGPAGATTRVPWQVMLRKAASTDADRGNVTLGPDRRGTVTLRNDGATVGSFDAFAFVGSDRRDYAWPLQKAPGSNLALPDLRQVGVTGFEFPGVPGDGLVQFAVSTWHEWSHPAYPQQIEVVLDVDRDGTPDKAVFTTELTGFAATGQTVVAVADLATQEAFPVTFLDADLNASTMILTVPVGDLGMALEDTVEADVYAYDNYFSGFQTDKIEGIVVSPGRPKFAAEPAFGDVPVDGATDLTVSAVPGGAAASPSQTGVLLLHRLQASSNATDVIRVRR